MTTPVPDLSTVPVVEASSPLTPATPSRPGLSTPITPPPAALLEGEQRAEDGGVKPVATE